MFNDSAFTHLTFFKKHLENVEPLLEYFQLVTLRSLFSGLFQLCFGTAVSCNIYLEKELLNTLKYFACFSLALSNVTIKKSL